MERERGQEGEESTEERIQQVARVLATVTKNKITRSPCGSKFAKAFKHQLGGLRNEEKVDERGE